MGLRSVFAKPRIIIVNYYAFISNESLHVRGRVLEDDKIVSLPSDSWVKNLRHLVKRMLTNEIAHAEIKVIADGLNEEIKANEEGFYEGTFKLITNDLSEVQLQVKSSSLPKNYNQSVEKIIKTTRIDAKVRYGIISDIDDTILVTGVVSRLKWRLLFNTMFLNPQKRKSFKNASAFYKKLGSPNNPIFYISNSPWNLFDYLKAYLTHQEFPKGYIRLRDYNIFSPKSHDLEKQNKYKEIIKAFQACPGLSFILIGDAGEVDTDIYLQIADKFPNRVKAIYIRSVTSHKRMSRIKEIEANHEGVPLLVFDHTAEMEHHAIQHGIIS